MWSKLLTVSVVSVSLFATGCLSSPAGIPKDLEPQIDKNLTFRDVLVSPESYKGHLIVLGGEILKATRLKKGMQLELLQLPLTTGQAPTLDRTQSQGRVLVLLHQEADPATLTSGTLVTFVGEVSGSIMEKMDEADYRYPILTVKHWHIWPPSTYYGRQSGPYFGVFGGTSVGGGSRGGAGVGIGF